MLIKPHKQPLPLLLGGYILLVLFLLSIIWGPNRDANADILQVSPLPTRITPTQTALPTAVPTIQPSVTPTMRPGDDREPAGYIVLSLSGFDDPSPYWTEIEWQTARGRWVTIENGWQGHPDGSGDVRWLVGSELLGEETRFRWRLYSREDGVLLRRSESFLMPSRSGETRFIEIKR